MPDRLEKFGKVGAQSRGAEDHAFVKILQILLAEAQGYARRLKPRGGIAQLFAAFAIPRNNGCAVREQKIDQWQIGDTKPDNRKRSGEALLDTSGQFQDFVPF